MMKAPGDYNMQPGLRSTVRGETELSINNHMGGLHVWHILNNPSPPSRAEDRELWSLGHWKQSVGMLVDLA